MMFGSFSALTVASSIVQFVDFYSRLLSGATEICYAKTGKKSTFEEFELIVNDIISVSDSFVKKSHPVCSGEISRAFSFRSADGRR